MLGWLKNQDLKKVSPTIHLGRAESSIATITRGLYNKSLKLHRGPHIEIIKIVQDKSFPLNRGRDSS